MTNTLTYSTTSFVSPTAGLLGLSESSAPSHYTPRFLSDSTTETLDHLACLMQQSHDALADNGSLMVMMAVVVGLVSMATAIGISICV